MGHLARFPQERLSGWYRIDEKTSAGAYSGDGLAPIAVIGQTLVNRLLTTYLAMRSLFR